MESAQDVNSLKDCLDVNLLLTAPNPKISVLQLCSSKRVGTVLPPTRWGKDAMVTESLFGEGCIIKVLSLSPALRPITLWKCSPEKELFRAPPPPLAPFERKEFRVWGAGSLEIRI